MPDFTCRLKQFRLAKGLTQEQLASAVGVRRETIMRLERRTDNPSLKLAVDISRTVEAPIEEILFLSKAVTTIHSLKLWKENLYDYLQ